MRDENKDQNFEHPGWEDAQTDEGKASMHRSENTAENTAEQKAEDAEAQTSASSSTPKEEGDLLHDQPTHILDEEESRLNFEVINDELSRHRREFRPLHLLKMANQVMAAKEESQGKAAKGSPGETRRAKEGNKQEGKKDEKGEQKQGEKANSQLQPPQMIAGFPFMFPNMTGSPTEAPEEAEDKKGTEGFNPFQMLQDFFSKMEKGEMPEGMEGMQGPFIFDGRGMSAANDSADEMNEGEDDYPFLHRYTVNLRMAAMMRKIDPLIGREKEVQRVMQILNRRTKNNPVLIGEPGVGKTAIAEGLAVLVNQGKVPASMRDLEIFQLDVAALVAGTQFRGQFEARVQGLLRELEGYEAGLVLLVVDELHRIVGAGDHEGSMDAANLLKPALAKGSIRIMGSTTLQEYRKFIEKDAALERRFQKVMVEEPSKEETLHILKGVAPLYEEYHLVSYSKDILRLAVDLADRYLPDRYFPDKAIDLLDEVGSKMHLGNKKMERLMNQRDEIMAMQQRLLDTEEMIEEEQMLPKPSEKTLNELYAEKAVLQAGISKRMAVFEKEESSLPRLKVTKEQLAEVLEHWTGIPVRQITEEESERLKKLAPRLKEEVIGQEEAIDKLTASIRRSRAGFSKKGKPASFLFVGSTGVGKTELAKALARTLFGREKDLIRLDMSEYMEAHTVSKLIGAPPGYVGYDQAGQLSERVRRHPYSVILVDEIEKAHKDIYNLFLQILDDGRLTDAQGRLVSFANCLIIMTSNIGTDRRNASFGFHTDARQAEDSRVREAVEQYFRPEFLNRLDEIVVFRRLLPPQLKRIVLLQLQEVRERLKELGLELQMEDSALEFLIKKGYSERYGARPLRRAIATYVESPLAELYLEEKLEGKKVVRLTAAPAASELSIELEA